MINDYKIPVHIKKKYTWRIFIFFKNVADKLGLKIERRHTYTHIHPVSLVCITMPCVACSIQKKKSSSHITSNRIVYICACLAYNRKQNENKKKIHEKKKTANINKKKCIQLHFLHTILNTCVCDCTLYIVVALQLH